MSGADESPDRVPPDGPWIEVVEWEDATGELKAAYDWQAAKLGAPTEYTQLGSLAPELVMLRLQLYRTVEAVPSRLSVLERRLAAFVTSSVNGTPHCSSGLLVQLNDLGLAEDVIARAAQTPEDLRSGDSRLDEIAAHSGVLAARPWEVTPEHIRRLRDVGLDDLEIVDLNNIVAYYAYTNRVANGLGLRTPVPIEHARGAVPA